MSINFGKMFSRSALHEFELLLLLFFKKYVYFRFIVTTFHHLSLHSFQKHLIELVN